MAHFKIYIYIKLMADSIQFELVEAWHHDGLYSESVGDTEAPGDSHNYILAFNRLIRDDVGYTYDHFSRLGHNDVIFRPTRFLHVVWVSPDEALMIVGTHEVDKTIVFQIDKHLESFDTGPFLGTIKGGTDGVFLKRTGVDCGEEFDRERSAHHRLAVSPYGHTGVDLAGFCAVEFESDRATWRWYLGMHERIPLRQLVMIDVGEEKRVQWAEELLFGLQSIHKAGLVHCDVSCGNVVVDQRGSALVSDLGSCFDPRFPETRYSIRSTIAFESLNMLDGGLPGPRDDIESLLYLVLWMDPGRRSWYNTLRNKSVSDSIGMEMDNVWKEERDDCVRQAIDRGARDVLFIRSALDSYKL